MESNITNEEQANLTDEEVARQNWLNLVGSLNTNFGAIQRRFEFLAAGLDKLVEENNQLRYRVKRLEDMLLNPKEKTLN